MTRLFTPLTLLAIVVALAVPARAVTVCKDGTCDHTSIAAALYDPTHNGEDVIVKPDVYNESNLTVGGSAQGGPRTLRSTDPSDPEGTVIDATGTGQPVIACLAAGSTLRGLTLQGGKGGVRLCGGGNVLLRDLLIRGNDAVDEPGGGLDARWGPVTITDCRFENNRATLGGGVYYGASSQLTITGSTFKENEAFGDGAGDARGGGIATFTGAPLLVEHSTVIANSATGSKSNSGAGISALGNTSLNDVQLIDNVANPGTNPSLGGGVSTGSSPLTLNGGVVRGNSADRGGGVHVGSSLTTLTSTASITGNTALELVAGSGGGIFCPAPQKILISAGTVSGNTPDDISCRPAGGLSSEPDDESSASKDTSGDTNDPINTLTGELFDDYPADIDLGGPMRLFFARYYSSGLSASKIHGTLGENWRHNFEWSLLRIGADLSIVDPRGRLIRFTEVGAVWELSGATDIVYQLDEAAGVYTLLDPRRDRVYSFNGAGQLTDIFDGHGNTHALTYAADGSLSEVSDGLGRSLIFTYDAGGKLDTAGDGMRTVVFSRTGDDLTQVTDVLGHSTTYSYAAGGLMTSTTLPRGNAPFVHTWGSGKVASETDSNGHTTTLSYSPPLTTITDPLGNARVHTHTADGELSAREDQAGLSFSMGSDATGRRDSLTDRLGDTTSVDYHAGSGRPSQVTNADGTTESYSHQARAFGGVTLYDIAGATYPDGTSDSVTYDANGNAITRVDRAGHLWAATYDGSGRPLTRTNPAGGITTNTYRADETLHESTDPSGHTTTWDYDALRRPNLITFADSATRGLTYDLEDRLLTTTNENGDTVALTYDANGNLATTTDPLGNTSTFTYDGNDRLLTATDPLGGVLAFTYDELGRPKTATDENGDTTTSGYDVLGRLTQITLPLGNSNGFTYDAEAVIASATDGLGNVTSFASDQMGRVTQATSPLGHIDQIGYDAVGRVTSLTDPLGRTTTFHRESRGLLSGIDLPGGVISASFARNALGNLTQITDPGGNDWLRAFDNQGLAASYTDPLGNVESLTRDLRNRPATITHADGTVQTLGYDPAGNLTSRSYSGGGPTFSYTYDTDDRLVSADGLTQAYDANGRIADSNGIAIGRDAGGRITSITLEAATPKTVTYSYDANGNLTSVTDWTGAALTFSYDAADRLIGVTRPAAHGVATTYTHDDDARLVGIDEDRGAVSLSSISLTRDASGQIVQATRSTPQAASAAALADTSHSFDAASQIAGPGFSYDDRGRLTGDGTRTYVWDAASRLSSVTAGATTTHTYDALGQRLSRSSGGVTRRFVWNTALGLSSISIERDAAGVDLRYFVHTPGGQLLFSVDAVTDARRFYHFDEMGNTTFVTDDAGAVIAAYAYSPFGRRIAATGGLENPFTWQGEMGAMDEGDGLYSIRERYYDAGSGRFLSRDPVRSIDPREINPYQYALGNPLRFVDVTGRSSVSMARHEARAKRATAVLADEQARLDRARRTLEAAKRATNRWKSQWLSGLFFRREVLLAEWAEEHAHEAWVFAMRRTTWATAQARHFSEELASARREESRRLRGVYSARGPDPVHYWNKFANFFMPPMTSKREARILHLEKNLDDARIRLRDALEAFRGIDDAVANLRRAELALEAAGGDPGEDTRRWEASDVEREIDRQSRKDRR